MEQSLANDMITLVSIIIGEYSHHPIIESNYSINKLSLIYRERKIFPLALVNYITMSGGGFARETGAKIRNFTINELIETVRFI